MNLDTVDTTRPSRPDRADLPCRTHDPDIFFGETNTQVLYAKALCASCPARAACLAGALERAEPWGVWGGELLIDGRVTPYKRGRGRPRTSGTAA